MVRAEGRAMASVRTTRARAREDAEAHHNFVQVASQMAQRAVRTATTRAFVLAMKTTQRVLPSQARAVPCVHAQFPHQSHAEQLGAHHTVPVVRR